VFNKVFALLGYYAALSGSSVAMFRDYLSVPFSKMKKLVGKLMKKTGRSLDCGCRMNCRSTSQVV
jgi:hypothetical protein